MRHSAKGQAPHFSPTSEGCEQRSIPTTIRPHPPPHGRTTDNDGSTTTTTAAVAAAAAAANRKQQNRDQSTCLVLCRLLSATPRSSGLWQGRSWRTGHATRRSPTKTSNWNSWTTVERSITVNFIQQQSQRQSCLTFCITKPSAPSERGAQNERTRLMEAE